MSAKLVEGSLPGDTWQEPEMGEPESEGRHHTLLEYHLLYPDLGFFVVSGFASHYICQGEKNGEVQYETGPTHALSSGMYMWSKRNNHLANRHEREVWLKWLERGIDYSVQPEDIVLGFIETGADLVSTSMNRRSPMINLLT